MTHDGEHLAKVTQLFGARARGGASSDEGAAGAGSPRDGSAGAGSDASGRSAGASPDASAGLAGAASDASAGLAGAASGSSADGWATGAERGSDEVDAEPAAGPAARGHLRAVTSDPAPLPTYAAFATTTETPRQPTVSFTDDTAADEPAEPDETLEAAQHRAENISLHALSRRGVSSHEMAKTLRSRDLPEEVVLAEVERLERVGLLDDAELAENLVRSKQERKGLGKGAISSELRQRGLAPEAIEAAMADIDDDEEQSRADEWAAKRAGQLRGLDQATAERRLNGFLMRRGYRSEVIRRAVERALPRGGGGSRGGVRFE